MKSRNKKLKKIVYNTINLIYEFKDDMLFENSHDIVSPSEIQSSISTMFAIDTDFAYLIVYEWLYDNGYKNIGLNWYTNITYTSTPNLFDNTVYGDNTFTIGDNTAIGMNNITIGYSHSDLTTSIVSPDIFIEGNMTTSSSPSWDITTTSAYLHRMCNE